VAQISIVLVGDGAYCLFYFGLMFIQDFVAFILFFAIQTIDVGASQFADILFDARIWSFVQELCKRGLLFGFQFEAH
jgi:hypothetical protein